MAHSSSGSTRLSPDQRPRNRRFVWTMLFVLTGFLLAFVAYRWWHLTWLAVALVVLCAGARWAAMLMADAYPRALGRRRG